MRIGIVCPYSFDVPGGVQFHVRDLAEYLLGLGHEVSVLAPADDDTPLPSYVVSCGRAVPVPYNGSVARVNIGPVSAARVGRWVERGEFDVVHIHEPFTPSVAILALWAVEGPLVATFHTSNVRSRAMQAFFPGARMVALPTAQHGVFPAAGSTCVNAAVTSYLLTAVSPQADVNCPATP